MAGRGLPSNLATPKSSGDIRKVRYVFGEVTAGFELLQRFDERGGTTLAAGPRIVSITIQRAQRAP